MDFYKYEDKYLKSLVEMYFNSLLLCFGYDYRIKKILNSEIVVNSARSIRMDFLAETCCGILINIEFLSTALNQKKIDQFHEYAQKAREKYGKKVLTIVVSTHAEKNETVCDNFALDSWFTMHVKSFKEFSEKKALNDIKLKIKQNKELSDKDYLKLSVIPFMRSDNKIDKVLWDVCSLVNKITDSDDSRLDALKWGLIVLVEKFVSNQNRKRRIFELIKMEGSYFYELYGKEKVEQGIEIGLEKGHKEGRDEKAQEVIQNLLNDEVNVELISKWTGVPINQIKSVKF